MGENEKPMAQSAEGGHTNHGQPYRSGCGGRPDERGNRHHEKGTDKAGVEQGCLGRVVPCNQAGRDGVEGVRTSCDQREGHCGVNAVAARARDHEDPGKADQDSDEAFEAEPLSQERPRDERHDQGR